MYTVDPNIALSGQPVQIQQPIDAYAKALSLKEMIDQEPLQQAQTQAAQLGVQQQQMQMDQTRAVNQAYQNAFTQNADGTVGLDGNKLTTALATAGHGAAIPAVMEGINKYQKAAADLTEANGKIATLQQDYAGSIGAAVKAANYDPSLFLTLAHYAAANKTVDPQQIAPIVQSVEQAMTQDPTGAQAKQLVQGISEHMIAASTNQQKLIAENTTAQARATTANAAAATKQEQDAASTLSLATSAADYEAKLAALRANPKTSDLADKFQAAVPVSSFDPKASPAMIRQMAMTPDQQVTTAQTAAQAAETAQRDKNTAAYQNAMIGQGQQRINNNLDANGNPIPKNQQQMNSQIVGYQNQENGLNSLRSQLGTAIQSGNVYVDKNGQAKSMTAASGGDPATQAALQAEMQTRYQSITDTLKKTIAAKNGIYASAGVTPQVSTDQAYAAIDAGDQKLAASMPGAAKPAVPLANVGSPQQTPAAAQPAPKPPQAGVPLAGVGNPPNPQQAAPPQAAPPVQQTPAVQAPKAQTPAASNPGAPAHNGPVSIRLPGGKIKYFPNQAAAQGFMKLANLQPAQ